jgi:hypothetical protein
MERGENLNKRTQLIHKKLIHATIHDAVLSAQN